MKIFLAAALICAALGGEARAFHPLTGDDTRFLGPDVKQVRSGLEYSVSDNGAERYTTSAFAEFSYDLLPGLETMVTIPWLGWSSRGISKSGLGDALVEAKFAVPPAGGWELALKPGFSLPAGNEADSLGAGKGGVWLYGIAGRRAGPWTVYLNAGYLYNRNSLDERVNILKASGAAALELRPGFLVSAELSAATNPDKASLSHPLYSVLGLTWSPYPTLDLDCGYRLGLNSGAAEQGLLARFTLRL